jgi:hypothetical protein
MNQFFVGEFVRALVYFKRMVHFLILTCWKAGQ